MDVLLSPHGSLGLAPAERSMPDNAVRPLPRVAGMLSPAKVGLSMLFGALISWVRSQREGGDRMGQRGGQETTRCLTGAPPPTHLTCRGSCGR